MRPIPINEAEAMLDPLWARSDAGDRYRLTAAGHARAHLDRSFGAARLQIERARPGKVAATLRRAGDVDLAGYDTFRLFATVPAWVRFTITAKIDGRSVVLMKDVRGRNEHDEFDGRFRGRRMSGLRIEFTLTEDRPAAVGLSWTMLADRGAQKRMEARRSPYTPDWPGMLVDRPGKAAPRIGIFFGARELAALRRRVRSGVLKDVYQRIRQGAERSLAAKPEADVGKWIPKRDRRWCRNRDMMRRQVNGAMERLALVGLIENNTAMSRLAARMALSAAHCETWCESVMGMMPGCTWHHRSFTEEIYSRACALVLDWAGHVLTDQGQAVIRDAIIMKGLPRIEADFKTMEYIRHMNQGIVFSSGRIIGAMGLLPAYPRYASLIDEAERDLHEMIDNYVHDDGGTLEGPGYWNYTFRMAMPTLLALARRRGKTLRQYATKTLIRTGDFGLAMRSIAGGPAEFLPVNDCKPATGFAPSLVAAYAQLSPRPEWKAMFAELHASGGLGSEMDLLFLAPAAAPKKAVLVKPAFRALPDVGQADSIRRDRKLGHVHCHLCTGPTHSGHYNEDKGSFLLEVEGEALAIDRGVTVYSHPETGLLKLAARHNLLYPEPADGRLVHQLSGGEGGRLASAIEQHGAVMMVSDNRLAWEPGVFRANLRRVFSPAADLYIFDDEVRLVEAMAVSFRLNSLAPMRQRGDSVWVSGRRASLCVTPLNWEPVEAALGPDGIDGNERPVNLMRLVAAPARSHRLLTAVQVVASGAEAPWSLTWDRRGRASRGRTVVELAVSRRPALAVGVDAGARRVRAVCEKDTWRVARRD